MGGRARFLFGICVGRFELGIRGAIGSEALDVWGSRRPGLWTWARDDRDDWDGAPRSSALFSAVRNQPAHDLQRASVGLHPRQSQRDSAIDEAHAVGESRHPLLKAPPSDGPMSGRGLGLGPLFGRDPLNLVSPEGLAVRVSGVRCAGLGLVGT